MAGFDVKGSGSDTKCQDIVKRLDDSCFVANMQDSAAESIRRSFNDLLSGLNSPARR